MKELASALTRDFAENLRTRIAAMQAVPIGAAPAQTAPTIAHSAPIMANPINTNEVAPLNAGHLFWRVLWARITGWFGRTTP